MAKISISGDCFAQPAVAVTKTIDGLLLGEVHVGACGQIQRDLGVIASGLPSPVEIFAIKNDDLQC